MWTRKYWQDLAERACKTFAQALVAVLTASATSILDVDWAQTFSVAGLATVVSVLTSIGSAGVGEPGTASAVSAVDRYIGRHRAKAE